MVDEVDEVEVWERERADGVDEGFGECRVGGAGGGQWSEYEWQVEVEAGC